MSEGAAPPPAAPTTPAPAASPTPEEGQGVGSGTPKPPDKPAEPPKPKAMPPPAPKMRKVMIDGVEESVDEDAVFRDYQKYRSGDKMLKEANLSKKQVVEFLRAFKENPRAVLSNPKLGVDYKQLAHDILKDEIASELADPRDTELESLRKDKAARDERDEGERTAKEQREDSERITAERDKVSAELHEVMGGTVLAKDSATLRQAAYYMRQCLLKGVDVTPGQVVEYLEGYQLNNYRSTANQYDGAQLTTFLGDEIVKKLRAHDLAELRKARGEKAVAKERTTPPTSQKAGGEPKYMDRYSASEMARKKLGL